MAEPIIKRRVLTKVRKHFLHKTPPEDNDVGLYTHLLATPEQLNENAIYLLEPSLGLVETNRNIYGGSQYYSLRYKINTIRVEDQFQSRAVTLGLKSNELDILPWQYCVKRLESYGDLELATWARRLKAYYENYPKLMATFFESFNSSDPAISSAIEAIKVQNALASKELDSKYAFKMSMYATKDELYPVSLSYGGELLEDMGFNLEGFLEWTKEYGIPTLFEGDSPLHLERSRSYLDTNGLSQDYLKDGPELDLQLICKEGEKKEMKVKISYVLDFAADGVLIHIYVVKNTAKEANKFMKCKYAKIEDSESPDDNYNREVHQEARADSEAELDYN